MAVNDNVAATHSVDLDDGAPLLTATFFDTHNSIKTGSKRSATFLESSSSVYAGSKRPRNFLKSSSSVKDDSETFSKSENFVAQPRPDYRLIRPDIIEMMKASLARAGL